MKNKNKIFIFGVTTISAIAVCASLVTTNKFGFNTNADDQYSFTFGLLTESTTECDGTYVGQTALGNTVKVDYTQVRKYGNNDYAYHNTGSSWEINKDTQLGSITSLVFDNVETSGSLTISCGWDVNGETGKVDYLVTLNKSCSRGSSATYDLSEYKPNYIKVYSVNGYAFDNATIKYECTPATSPVQIVDGFVLFDYGEGYRVSQYIGSDTNLVFPSECNGKPVKKIDSRVFYDNKTITSVVIPSSYTHIGDYIFSGCTNLESVTLNEGLGTIGMYCFQNCSKLTTVAFPNSLKTINSYAFYGCTGITTFTYDHDNTNLEFVGNGAFRLTKITSFYIPKTATSFYETFISVTQLQEVVVDEENPNYSSENGVFYNKNKTTLLIYPQGKTDETFVMPNTVTTAGDYSLQNTYIKNLTFSSALKSFGGYNYCLSLETVDFNNWKVDALQSYAFSRMNNMTEITIPEGVKHIYGLSLSENKELTTINLPSTIQSIDNTYSITSNPKLTTINFAGTVAQWTALGKTNFTYSYGSGCPLLTQITCSDGVVTL